MFRQLPEKPKRIGRLSGAVRPNLADFSIVVANRKRVKSPDDEEADTMADLQRKYQSLERRREHKIPKVPQMPDKVFYRILDGAESRSKKKHVKFQMLGEEDEETRKKSIHFLERSPIPARYTGAASLR